MFCERCGISCDETCRYCDDCMRLVTCGMCDVMVTDVNYEGLCIVCQSIADDNNEQEALELLRSMMTDD